METVTKALSMQPFPSSLDAILLDATSCERCVLSKTALTTVLYRGDPFPRVLFVGEAPGAEEDVSGIPFVGQSGTRLEAKIAEAPFPRYGITNVVLHRPPENRYNSVYGDACFPFLVRTVKALRPAVLVPVGRNARMAIARASFDIPSFSLCHPSAMNFDPRMRVEWEDGWRKLRLWLSGRGVVPE